MLRAWYERRRDQKDSIYFSLHKMFHKMYRGGHIPFPSFHNSIEFAFVIEGDLEITVNETQYTVKSGEVIFIDSREPHKYVYNESTQCYVVLISSGFFTDANQLGKISFPTHSAKCEQFEYIKQYLDYALAHWDPDSILCKLAFADTIAFLMTRYYPSFPKKESTKHNSVLLDAVEYICEHYREDLSIADVAKALGYSANYFSSTFNELMGESFPDYVNACRMVEYFRVHRERPDLSVERAAELCGFGSMRSFYRARKRFLSENADSEMPKQETK